MRIFPLSIVCALIVMCIFLAASEAALGVEPEEVVLIEEFVAEECRPFVHSATIAETKPGELVAAWYGGSYEGDPDVSIFVSVNDGTGWSEPTQVDDGADLACWNPVLFQPSEGPLLLYYKIGYNWKDWKGYVRTSSDGGRTWSERIRLPLIDDPYLSSYGGGFVGPIKNKPLELTGGTLLCGSSTEDDGWQVHLERTRGDYVTDFELIGPISPRETEVIQPTFLVLSSDYESLRIICRHHSGDRPKTSRSDDGGATWGPWEDLALSNVSTAGLDAVTLKNGMHLLAYSRGFKRRFLALAVSIDGETWIEALPRLDSKLLLKMDYPSIIQTSDGMVHLVYSWAGHSRIKHMVIDPDALADGLGLEIPDR